MKLFFNLRTFRTTVRSFMFIGMCLAVSSAFAQGKSDGAGGGNSNAGGNSANSNGNGGGSTTQGQNDFALLSSQSYSITVDGTTGVGLLEDSHLASLISNTQGAFKTSSSISYTYTKSKSSFSCYDLGKSFSVSVTVVGTATQGTNTFTHSETTTVNVNVTGSSTVYAKAKSGLVVKLDQNGVGTLTASSVDDGSYSGCGSITSLALDKSTFSCSDLGSSVNVKLTATSELGVTGSTVTAVSVVDEIAPVALAKNITLKMVNGVATISVSDINNGSYDNCEIVKYELSKTEFSCADNGINQVTLTVTDKSGLTASTTFEVIVVSKVYAKTKSGIVVKLDKNGEATLLASSLDDGCYTTCGTISSLTIDKSSFSCADAGKTVSVVLTATTDYGFTASSTTLVSVVDEISPVAIAKNVSLNLVNGSGSISIADVNNGSYDNCEIVKYELSKSNFTCSDNGTNQVTLTVTDKAGLTASTTFEVTVNVVSSVAITSPSSFVFYGAPSPYDRAVLTATADVSNCTFSWTGGSTAQTSTYVSGAGVSSKLISVTATDAQGCSVTDDYNVCVFDIRCGTGNTKVSMYKNNNQMCVATSAVVSQLSSGTKFGIVGKTYSCSNAPRNIEQAEEVGSLDAVSKIYVDNQNENIHFQLVDGQNVTIELYNLDGKLVQTIFKENIDANVHYVAKLQKPVSGIPYFVVLKGDSGITKSMVVL